MALSKPSSPTLLWLRRAAYAGWLLLALAFLIFFLLDLSLDYKQLLEPCEGSRCNYLAISPAEVEVLESWGLTTRFYALAMTTMTGITVTVYGMLAGFILWRQPNFLAGLAVSLSLLVIPITMIADTDNVVAAYPALNIPLLLISALGTGLLLLFLYLLPNGKFYPRWSVVPLAISFFLVELMSFFVFTDTGAISDTVTQAVFTLFITIMALPILLQLIRYRRVSTTTERLQTRWLLFALVIFVTSIPVWAIFFGGFVEIPAGLPRLLGSMAGWYLSMIASLALPVAVAIAIFRYRLWNIDLIIRKSLIYLVLTLTLFLVYFGFIIVLQSLFGGLLGDRYDALATVISTLAVAALFNPFRRRIQDTIDRRFYRQKYDTELILATFNSSLRDEVDLARLQESILTVVQQTMQPDTVSLWLRRDAE